MGDRITESVGGDLTFIPYENFNKILNKKRIDLDHLDLISYMCRLNTLYMIARAGSGHIGSSFSSLDIFTFMLINHIKKDDIFFSSKGHDAPGLYSVMIAKGILDFDLLHQLRRLNGLPGHPDINTKGIFTNTGSLGMGISKAKGMVFAKRLKKESGNVIVLTGDGEIQEGQFWESLISAVNYNLHEITVIIDHNKIQSDTYLKNVSDLGDLESKFKAFGWEVKRCNGNDIQDLLKTLNDLKEIKKPKIIIADTIKGCGVSFMEHTSLDSDSSMYKFHSGAPDEQLYYDAVDELVSKIQEKASKLNEIDIVFDKSKKNNIKPKNNNEQKLIKKYSELLIKHAEKNKKIIALDADLILDTGLIPFKDQFPERFIECGIAEQDMVSIAGGLALQNLLPIVHSFSCFLSTRPIEQIYNNSTEKKKIIYVGSLAGVLPAGPGHSHQAIRDISTIGSIPHMKIIEPASEDELEYLFSWAIDSKNTDSVFLRLTSVPWAADIKTSKNDYSPGKGIEISGGKELAIVTYGPIMINLAQEIASLFEIKNKYKPMIINHPWLNYLDQDWFEKIFSTFSKILVIDNHLVKGGINEIYAQAINKSKKNITLYIHGLEDIPPSGDNYEVLSHLGYDPNFLMSKIDV